MASACTELDAAGHSKEGCHGCRRGATGGATWQGGNERDFDCDNTRVCSHVSYLLQQSRCFTGCHQNVDYLLRACVFYAVRFYI